MKIRKKALSLFLALTMVVGTFASTVAFATTEAAPEIQDASLTVDNGLTLNFSVNEGLDLSKDSKADVQVSYFTKNENGDLTPIHNTIASKALVKDKTWDGFLWGVETRENYPKGTAGTAAYEDVIPADTKLATLVKAGYHENNDMDYVEIDWATPATYVAQIKVTDNDGIVSEVKTVEATVTAPGASADASDIESLTEALQDENIKTINIKDDISDIDASLVVDRAVTINGGGYTLTFTGLEAASTKDDGLIIEAAATVENLKVNAGLSAPQTWVGTYAIHVYNTTATLKDVTVTNGNGGILVNGSNVTLAGAIDVSDNGFGGIEVSKGTGLPDSKLMVSGTLINYSEAYGQPTIWVVDGQGSIAGNPGVVLTSNDDIADGQTQYYLDAAKSGKPVITLRNVPATVTTEEKVPENEYGKITSFTPDNRTPIKVALTVGKKGYQKVRVVVEGLNDGVQLIAKDTSGNWYNIVKTGWGPTDGFELADATTDVYLVANATGNYEATIKLVDVSNSNKVLAMATTSGIALDPAALAEVSDIGSLKTALANGSITTINITKDISNIDAALIVNHEVTVNGQGHKLTFTSALNTKENGQQQGILVEANDVTINDLTVKMAGATGGWQGVYGIQVYNVTGVTLNNVTTSGADGGILVNGSEVELTGTTAVGGNEFGGIEVSKGTGLPNSKLTVTGALVNDTEVYKQPTIWLVNEQGTVNSVDNFTQNATINNEQTQYYIMSAHAYAPTTSSAAQTAIDAVKGISSSDALDHAKEIKTAVQSVQCLNNEDKAKLKPADIKKLDELLTAVVDGSVTTEVAAPETSDIPNPIDRLTHEPAVSGLLLAAGITGSETTSVSLRTTQVVPTGSGSVLALQLDLTVGGNPIHTLLVPVTVKIQLPSSFVYNPSSKDYKIQHVKNDGTSEDLPLTISGVSGAYTGTFTTSSFSTFTVVGTNKSSSNPGSGSNPGTVITTPTATFVSDTTTDFNVNGAYQFKITSTNGQAPTLVVGTAGVFNTQLVKTEGNDYYFKLTAIGAPGARAGVYVNGVKLLIATVAVTAATVQCDTTLPFNVKAGAAYTFKITADAKPSFAAGTSTAFKVEFVKVVGKDYFFKVTAVGKVGAASGFYINSQKAPVTVATITK